MFKTACFFLFSVLMLSSCGSNVKPGNSKYSKIEVNSLTEQDIYTYPKVKAFMDQFGGKTVSGNNLFLKGVDAFRNKKNLDSANHYFKASILEYPSNMAFYELGNVAMEEKAYEQAIMAYEMAEKMGYEPFSNVLYNISCAHSLMGDEDLAGEYLEYAIQAGYSNIENINTDPDLANLRKEDYYFQTHLKKGLKGLHNADNMFWLQFKRKFNPLPFPLKLDDKLDVLLLNDETRIAYDFEKYISEMRDEEFSREVSKGFYYLAKINETDAYIAFVYVMRDEYASEDDPVPLTFRLITYDKAGKLIDKKEIAGRTNIIKPLKVAVFEDNLNFSITSYETIFEKDPAENGYYQNKIVKKKKIGIENYTISAEGTIVKKVNEEVTLN